MEQTSVLVLVQTSNGGIEVDCSPLNVASSTHNLEVVRPFRGQFEICPNRITRTVPLFLRAFATFVLLVLGLIAVAGKPEPMMLLIALGPLLFMSVSWLVPKFLFFNVLFDRETGRMTYRWLGRTQTRPLSEIVAVQLIAGHMEKREAGVFDATRQFEHSDQVNLVFNDKARLCLSHHAVRPWSERLASDLARFLAVPRVVWLDEAARVVSELEAREQNSLVTAMSRLQSSIGGLIVGARLASAIVGVLGVAAGAVYGAFGGGVPFPFAGVPVQGVLPGALWGMVIGIVIGVPIGAITGLVAGAFRPELLAWFRRKQPRS